MSLPAELWRALAVEPAVLRARQEFFASFVELRPPPYDRRALAELLAETPPRRSQDAVVNLLDEQDEIARGLMRRSPPETPSAPDRWVSTAERADALREAAIATLTLDTDAGRTLLVRAGEEYSRLGLPFGSFLSATATGEPMSAATLISLGELVGFAAPVRRWLETDTETGELSSRNILRAPEQQVFLLLAAVADAPDWPSGLLDAVTRSGQQRRSVVVGSLAGPLSAWWETARLIAELATGDEAARFALREHLAGLAQVHGEQLAFAQQDTYNWERAMARVDVVDLDLAGTVAQSARVLRRRQLPRWNVTEEFGELPPLARVSLTVGLQLGGGGVAYEDEPWDPNPSPHPAEHSSRQAD